MSLARRVAELYEKCRHAGISPFDANSMEAFSEALPIVTHVQELGFQDAGRALRLCLQALAVQRSELEPQLVSAEFVATIPTDVPGLARPTRPVISEMIQKASKEVILLGYELTDEALIHQLAESVARGVDVLAILDRQRGAAGRILHLWPDGVKKPRLFRDRERTEAAPHSAMHAKCLLIDEHDLLVTSANFTFHGMHGNIEMGIRLSGASAAEARKIFSHLVECGLVHEINE